jgi:excinuclease UvrABC helicase subunit UvrB
VSELAELDKAAYGGDVKKLIKDKRQQMHEAADALDFETAALLRDEIGKLEEKSKKKALKSKKQVWHST